ncbi:hypothetical protein XELAEV_18004424mg [Xenopus laevis]|uniref:Uncharacterized protein n=1 Tax=Xenopus laevis TaxID=8355 RepID=A0A974BNL3_XENLA|nr:hypothetical protein XELAEV_18004424mg [Xenopus laevis]
MLHIKFTRGGSIVFSQGQSCLYKKLARQRKKVVQPQNLLTFFRSPYCRLMGEITKVMLRKDVESSWIKIFAYAKKTLNAKFTIV